MIKITKFGTLPFVFVVRCGRCWIATHCSRESGTWAGLQDWGHKKCNQRIESVAIVEKMRRLRKEKGPSFAAIGTWLASSSTNTSSFEILVPNFTGHVMGTIGQSKMYFSVATYIILDVDREKPKLVLHIVGGTKLLL